MVAREKRVQRVVDRFWQDPENRMDLRTCAIQTALSLFGEQFVRFYVDAVTGRVVIRQLDLLNVTAIETDPEDVERPLRYLYAPPAATLAGSSEGGGALGEGTWLGAGRWRTSR